MHQKCVYKPTLFFHPKSLSCQATANCPPQHYCLSALFWKISLNFLWRVLYFTEIGYGWGAASINSKEEYSLIREGQKTFSNSYFYWMRGTTNIEQGEILDFSNYIANNSGKIDRWCLIYLTCLNTNWIYLIKNVFIVFYGCLFIN